MSVYYDVNVTVYHTYISSSKDVIVITSPDDISNAAVYISIFK